MRASAKRTFTLQLYDRIELPPEPEPSGGMPACVRDALQGHKLECPGCKVEPECVQIDTDAETGTYGDPPRITRTLTTHCARCCMRITYDIDADGRPRMMSQYIYGTSGIGDPIKGLLS